MSDCEDFQAARDAGLKARHETRLARAQAALPAEAVDAARRALYARWPDDWHSFGLDVCGVQPGEIAREALEAALPHLRPHETREARAIRREVAEEIAARLDRIVTNVTGAVEAIKDDPTAKIATSTLNAYRPAQIAREIGGTA